MLAVGSISWEKRKGASEPRHSSSSSAQHRRHFANTFTAVVIELLPL